MEFHNHAAVYLVEELNLNLNEIWFSELSFQYCEIADWMLRNMRRVHHVEDATTKGLKSLHECNNPQAPPGAQWAGRCLCLLFQEENIDSIVIPSL